METTHDTAAKGGLARFKSYYVVWKPIRAAAEKKLKEGLNRTM